MKTCTKCGQTKDHNQFSKDRSKKDGYKSNCKVCCTRYKDQRRAYFQEYDRQRYQEKKYEIEQKKKTYRKKNKGKISEYGKEYRDKNLDHILKRQKLYKRMIREQLTDEYIKNQIMKTDWPFGREDITPELIERKRLQIYLHRQIKSLK